MMLKAEAGGGASFAIGDKVLTFAPETVAQTVRHFDEIRELLNSCFQFQYFELAGEAAGQDDVSALARRNLMTSTINVQKALRSGTEGMFEVSGTIRDNGAAYASNDALPSQG